MDIDVYITRLPEIAGHALLVRMPNTPHPDGDETSMHLHPLIGSTLTLPTGAQAHVLRMLGEGGCGETWLVRIGPTDAALKLPHRDGGRSAEERLINEMRMLSQIDHPGIPRLLYCGTHNGRPYLLMDRVDGISGTALTRERMPLRTVLLLAAQLADAVACVHAEGIIHSDIKPQNICIGNIPDRGGSLRACLIDFGLAIAPDDNMTRLTTEGQTLGTHGFLDPATIGKSNRRTAASDIFGLGATIASWCLGEKLFSNDAWWNIVQTRMAVLRSETDTAHATHQVDAIVQQRIAGIPHRALRSLLRQMLHGDMAQRPAARKVRDVLVAMAPGWTPACAGDCGTDAVLNTLRRGPPLSVHTRDAIQFVTMQTSSLIAALFASAVQTE